MGQKVNPIGLRLGINKTWHSKWFSDSKYSTWLKEDIEIRKFVKQKYKSAGVAYVNIERAANKCKVNVFASKVGLIIGKKGVEIDHLKRYLQTKSKNELFLYVNEIRKPDVEAQLVAENICQQLERRLSFRRVMKKAMQVAQKFGVKGIKVAVTGRLGGAEMSRREWYREGRVPLHTLRADIDYGLAEAHTTYGRIGCKVWLFKGEIFDLPENKN